MNQLNYQNNRTVAFLDILGFKQKISETPIEELTSKYEKLIDTTEALNRPTLPGPSLPTLFPDHKNNSPWCIKNIFSDSIILISHDNTQLSTMKLLVYAWRLTQVFIAYKMPLRGAITCGELYTNPQKSITLGKALTSAYELENKQQWIGVVIDNCMKESMPELFQHINNVPILSDIFFEYDVPFKDGSTKRYHTLNWRWNMIVKDGTRSLFSESQDGGATEKINNALAYAKSIIDSKRVYVQNQDQLPVELRSFWVGDQQPPFAHGDDL
jgi:hypothetical protein